MLLYISQFIKISSINNIIRINDTFQSFVIRHRLLTERLIKKWFCCNLCKFSQGLGQKNYALFSKYGVSVRTRA